MINDTLERDIDKILKNTLAARVIFMDILFRSEES